MALKAINRISFEKWMSIFEEFLILTLIYGFSQKSASKKSFRDHDLNEEDYVVW